MAPTSDCLRNDQNPTIITLMAYCVFGLVSVCILTVCLLH